MYRGELNYILRINGIVFPDLDVNLFLCILTYPWCGGEEKGNGKQFVILSMFDRVPPSMVVVEEGEEKNTYY